MSADHPPIFTKAICIADLPTALLAGDAAVQIGIPLILISEADAGVYAGGGWWRALTDQIAHSHPDLDATAILDCGDHIGAALNAIRAGCRDLMAEDPSPALMGYAAKSNVVLHNLPTSILTLGKTNARTGTVIRRFLENGS